MSDSKRYFKPCSDQEWMRYPRFTMWYLIILKYGFCIKFTSETTEEIVRIFYFFKGRNLSHYYLDLTEGLKSIVVNRTCHSNILRETWNSVYSPLKLQIVNLRSRIIFKMVNLRSRIMIADVTLPRMRSKEETSCNPIFKYTIFTFTQPLLKQQALQ